MSRASTDTAIRARIVEKGLIDCFEAGLTTEDGDLLNAEVSAVVFDGKKLIFASDKPVPGEHRSEIFAIDYDGSRLYTETFRYYTASPIQHAVKFEDFALTPDRRNVIATTAFDRVEDESVDLDRYNMIVTWPLDHPERSRIATDSVRQRNDRWPMVRSCLSRALGDVPYFKIEGLAALRGPSHDRLLFGIREVGSSHKDFSYVMKVVSAPYRMENDELRLDDEFQLVYDYDPAALTGLRHPIGLSSIEYDPYGERLVMLASFEHEGKEGNASLGGYLWTMSLEAFAARRAPQLVSTETGEPLEFANKAEGVAAVSASRLFVVFDNDRVLDLESDRSQSERRANQAPYVVVELL